MSGDVGAVELRPITATDLGPVAAFLHEHLNPRLSPDAWARALRPSWPSAAPDHGYHLRHDGRVVGAYVAFYADREVAGTSARFCNLAAWCVLEDYRTHALRLVRALLRQRDLHFVDLSPSGSVIDMNERLGFQRLDTTTDATLNLPWPSRRGRVLVTSDPARLDKLLTGAERRIHRDHREAAGARHVLLRSGDRQCYVVFRHDRRKRLPVFASLLHVSDPALLLEEWRAFTRHLLVRHRVAVTLSERRVTRGRPPGSVVLPRSRPKMFRSPSLGPDDIDYLYSELTNVAW